MSRTVSAFAPALIASVAFLSLKPALGAQYTLSRISIPNAKNLSVAGMASNGLYYGSFDSTVGGGRHLFAQKGATLVQYDLGSVAFATFSANAAGEFAGSLQRGIATYMFTIRNGVLKEQFRSNPPAVIACNDARQMLARNMTVLSGHYFGELFQTGKPRVRLSYPDYADTVVTGLNASGAILGYAFGRRTPFSVGFIYSGGVYTPVQGPGGIPVSAEGMNDAGDLVLQASDGGGYLKSGSAYTRIAVPGTLQTYPRGLNNRGAVYGTYVSPDHVTHGFVYKGGTYTSFDPLRGASFSGGYLYGMDDAGNVVGVESRKGAAESFYAACTGSGC